MEKPAKKKTSTPHDRFFRAMFQIVSEAMAFIEAMFPEDFVLKIDKSCFELDTTTYVDEDLQPNYSDLCYVTRLLSQEAMRVNILFEHKGQIPKLTLPEPVQIATYKTGIWRLDFLNKRKPTFVFAALLHHGKRKYKKRPFADYFEGLPPEWHPYVDDIKFFVLDLNKMTDEEIMAKLGGYIIGSALLALKHAHEPEYFENNLSKLFNFEWQKYSPELLESFIKTLFFYLEKVTKMNSNELIQKANNLPKELNEMATITIESVFYEGKAEGKAEGVAVGMEKGMTLEAERKNSAFVKSMLQNCPDFSDEKIALIAAVPVLFVRKIKKELAAKTNGKTVVKPVHGRRQVKK